MPNVYASLKSEIVRIARKEVRAETLSLRKANAEQRNAISALKRQVSALEKEVRQTRKSAIKALSVVEAVAPAADENVQRRFSPTRLAAHRAKLGLSASAYGKLVGMSGATVYLWEKGESRPSAENVNALAKLKLMPMAEIQALLAA
jgi:DNA-binding transcriptional regulator YiaG